MNNIFTLHLNNNNNNKFYLIEDNSIITIPIEFNNIVNTSISSFTIQNQNKFITFLLPVIINDWKLENLVKKNTKRIKFTITIINNISILKIENFFKQLKDNDFHKDNKELKMFEWNEEIAKNYREIEIIDKAIIKIPTEFNHLRECSNSKLVMTHYRSPINFLAIKWKIPVLNIKKYIIKEKYFKLMLNQEKKVIINKDYIDGIEIAITLELDLKNLNPFDKLVRSIVFNPIKHVK